MCNDEQLSSVISKIVTRETAIRGMARDAGDDEKRNFLSRYQIPIFRYLVAILRDSNEALEVFQIFSLRYLEGSLCTFDPGKGSFSKYTKTVLRNLIADYCKTQKRELRYDAPLPSDPFKSALIDNAWSRLQRLSEERQTPFFELLHAKSENRKTRSADLATQFDMTAENVRQIIKRGREHFGNALIDAVMEFCGSGDRRLLRDELFDLGLMPYCESQFADRFGERPQD